MAERVVFPVANNTNVFRFNIFPSMTPDVTILVFGMSDSGVIFADQRTVTVSGLLKNKVRWNNLYSTLLGSSVLIPLHCYIKLTP